MSSAQIHIPPELFAPAESSHFEGALELPVLKNGPDLYSFAAPLTWQADVTNTGDAFLVTGTVEGSATTSCARCLENVEWRVMGEIEGYFLIGSDSEAPEDMDDDEFDVLPESHDIDMEPLIVAAVLLELPLVPLCDDECKGLCSQCGANLNEGACACEEKSQDDFKPNPFAALKDYSFDN